MINLVVTVKTAGWGELYKVAIQKWVGDLKSATKHPHWNIRLLSHSKLTENMKLQSLTAKPCWSYSLWSFNQQGLLWFLCCRAEGCYLATMIVMFWSTSTSLILQTWLIQRQLQGQRQYFNTEALYPRLNKEKLCNFALLDKFCKFSSDFFGLGLESQVQGTMRFWPPCKPSVSGTCCFLPIDFVLCCFEAIFYWEKKNP